MQAVKKGDTIFIGQYLFTGSETTSVWLEVLYEVCNSIWLVCLNLSLWSSYSFFWLSLWCLCMISFLLLLLLHFMFFSSRIFFDEISEVLNKCSPTRSPSWSLLSIFGLFPQFDRRKPEHKYRFFGFPSSLRISSQLFVRGFALLDIDDLVGQVNEVKDNDVVCVTKNSATLAGSLFTLHACQIRIDLPTLSDKDKQVSIGRHCWWICLVILHLMPWWEVINY